MRKKDLDGQQSPLLNNASKNTAYVNKATSSHVHLHIKLERKANKEVFVTKISTILEVNNMVTMAT